jgi:putative transposase
MLLGFVRNRTSTIIVELYILCICILLLGLLSLRNTSKALDIFDDDEKRSHIAIWNWIQRFGSCQIYNKRKRVSSFIVDETIIQIGNNHFCWLWIAIEPVHKTILGMHISNERNICL